MKRRNLLVWLIILLLGLCGAGAAESLGTLYLPDSLVDIEAQAFAGNKEVVHVVMPEHVMSIGSMAFSDCSNLERIVLSDSVECIGSFAFNACDKLTSMSLPDALTEISDGLFFMCTGLEEVNIPVNARQIGEMAFWGCALKEIELTEGLESIGREAFGNCIDLFRINIPASVRTIGDGAFMGCESLTEMVIPEGVQAIGENAFVGCSALEWIYLPRSITSIGTDGVNTQWDGTMVMVAEGSYAHEWCEQNGVTYDFYIRATPTPKPTPTPTASPVPTPTPDPALVMHRALLIGNTYPDRQEELLGPDNDLAGMTAMLRRQSGTPFSVTSRLNVTADDVREAIASTFAGADSNDVSLFYYSGHGANSVNADSLGALCCLENTYVNVNELRAWLDTVPGKKIVLLDSCYSGNHIGKSRSGADSFDPDQFNDSVIAAFSARTRANLAGSSYYVITACSKNQNSYSIGSSYTNFWYGLFTYGVTKGSGFDMLKQADCSWYADTNGDEDITLGEVYNYVLDTVKRLGYEQASQYYGDTAAVLWEK